MRHLSTVSLALLVAFALAQAPTPPTVVPCPAEGLLQAQIRELVQHVTVESKRTDRAEEQILALRVELAETRGGRGGIFATLERLGTLLALGLSAYAVYLKK